MKRTVERKIELPSFSLGLNDLEALWGRAQSLFDSQHTIYSTLRIPLPGEELRFDSVDELRAYDLRGEITDFSLHFSQGGNRSVSVRRSSFFTSDKFSVVAESDVESWSAGATDTIYSFLTKYKTWHHRIQNFPLGTVMVVGGNIPLVISTLFKDQYQIGASIIFPYYMALVLMSILYFKRARWFPSASIRISEEVTPLKKYESELKLVGGAIAWLASFVATHFLSK